MKKILTLFIAAMALASANAQQDEAETAVLKWLALIDAGQYAESYDYTATLFQNQLNQSQWEQALISARQPFGDLNSRELTSTTESKSLPGAPDGEYKVYSFETSFANKDSATEMITVTLEGERWLAVGYFIR